MVNRLQKYISSHSERLSYVLTSFAIMIFFFWKKRFILEISLDDDEMFSWRAISGSWPDFFMAILSDSQQFLYFGISKAFHDFLGPDDYWLRVPSLVISSLAVGLVYYLFRRIYPGIVAALVCGLVFLNPVFGTLSVYHRPYALLTLLAVINLFIVWKLISDKDKRELYNNLFLISLLLMLYTHYLGVVYVASILAAFYLLKFRIVFTRRKIIAAIVFAVLYVIQFCYQISHSLILIKWTKFDGGAFHHIGFPYLMPNPLNSAQAIITLVCLFLFLVMCVLRKLDKNKEQDVFVLYSVLVFVFGLSIFFFVSLSPVSLFVEKYLWFYFIFLLAPVAYVLNTIVRFREGTTVITMILLFVTLTHTGDYYLYDRPNVREFFQSIKDEEFVKEEKKLLCSYDDGYVGVLTQYSKMYLKRDICTKHIYSYEAGDLEIKDFDYVVRFLSLQPGSILKSDLHLLHDKIVFRTKDFLVYKK